MTIKVKSKATELMIEWMGGVMIGELFEVKNGFYVTLLPDDAQFYYLCDSIGRIPSYVIIKGKWKYRHIPRVWCETKVDNFVSLYEKLLYD